MNLDSHIISLGMLMAGAVVALAGLTICLRGIVRFRGEGSQLLVPRKPSPISWRLVVAAGILAMTSLGLGMEGIERRGMTHNEAYVPGIDLPERISEPPRRKGLAETVRWHFHAEPHPQGYYFLMWGWTKAFGTSLRALRLPSVLFGALAVILVFAVANSLYGSRVGLLASLLLALNGYHVYWMQQARMYELSLLLAIASLWLWLKVLRDPKARLPVQIGYVVVTTLGLYTQVYFWPLLAGQMVFTVFGRTKHDPTLPHAFSLQTLSVVLGSPTWAKAAYKAPLFIPQDWTSWSFIQDYLNFGFLFLPDDWSPVERDIPFLPELGLTLIALVALGMFVSHRGYRWEPTEPPTPMKNLSVPLAVVSGGFMLILLALSREVYDRNLQVAATAAVPPIATMGYMACMRLARRCGLLDGSGLAVRGWSSPVFVVTVVSVGSVLAIGLALPFLIARGMLVVVPSLLIVLAGGLVRLADMRRLAGSVAIAIAVAASAWSVAYYRERPEPNDHRTLAAQLLERMEPEDRIFVPRRDWVTTPIYYHLPKDHHRLVAEKYGEVAADSAVTRIWILTYSDIPTPDDIATALEGFEATEELMSLRSRATLHQRVRRE